MLHQMRKVMCCTKVLRSASRGAILLCLLRFVSTPAFAQKNIVSLSPTYDFDGDGLSEFLTLEKQNDDDVSPSHGVYYEIDDFGAHIELWRHTAIDQILTAQIGDMDGDGSPEITVLSRSSPLGAGADDPPWLKVFPWTGVDFSPRPSVSLGGTRDSERIRPSGLATIDYNTDGTDEMAYAESSPTRSVSMRRLDNSGQLSLLNELSTDVLQVGYAPIHVTTVDHNRDDLPDLMAVSAEHDQVRIQVFLNEGGRFTTGPAAVEPYTDETRVSVGLIPSGIAEVDIDQDGTKEVVLPFESGTAIAIATKGASFEVRPLDTSQAALFHFPEPLTEDAINNILLDRAEMGIVGRALQQLNLTAVAVSPQEAEEEPEPVSRIALTAEPVEMSTVPEPQEETEQSPASIARVSLSAIPVATPETQVAAEPVAQDRVEPISASPVTTPRAGRMRQIQLSTLGDRPEASSSVEISDTLNVGETFVRPVEPSTGTMVSFRPVSLPGGASFSPSTRAITWTPTPSQIGIHKIVYEITVQGGGGRAAVEEVRGQGVTVRTDTRTESIQFNILVQQP